MIYGIHRRFSNLLIAPTYKLFSQLSIALKKFKKFGFKFEVLFHLDLLAIEPDLFI